MRITRVDIKKWRLLQNPQAEFRTPCAVIIGENGSGKSTLLELILSVFELVYKRLKDSTAVGEVDGFYLEYETKDNDGNDHQIVFESGYLDGSKAGDLKISIDGSPYSIKDDKGERLKSLLPTNIIAYYAGNTERVKGVCKYFVEWNLDAVRKSGNDFTLTPLHLPEDTPFIYSDIYHLSIALTSLLVGDGKSNVLRKLNLKPEMVNVTVRLKKPQWATAGSGDFWGNSSQLFNDFLSGLIDHSISTRSGDDFIETEVSAMNLRDYLEEIGIAHRGVFLFQIFDLLYTNGLLDYVDVSWKNNGTDTDAISIEYFSEGEKQVIMTSALIEFWDKENCLFLLDEPDTFLHPKWQSHFLPEVMENLKESQAIITTHSPLMLSTISKDCELFMMKSGKITFYTRSTYGMEASDIIEDAMGATPRDNRVAQQIKAIEKDISDNKLEDAKKKLAEIEKTGVGIYDINRLRTTIERFELLGI